MQTTYFKGDLAEYTGKTQEFAGGTIYELKLLEGHLKDQKRWTVRPPQEIKQTV